MKRDFEVLVTFFLVGDDGEDGQAIFSDSMPCFPTYQVGQHIFLEIHNMPLENDPAVKQVLASFGQLKSSRYEIIRIDHSNKLHVGMKAKVYVNNEGNLATNEIYHLRTVEVIVKEVK